MRTAKTPERTNNRKKRVTLLGVIANGSTSDARKLLMKYDEPDAKNHDDLEYRLTKLYQKAPDKIQFEKELSAIHPHKDFILKYNSPVPELTEIPKEVILVDPNEPFFLTQKLEPNRKKVIDKYFERSKSSIFLFS
jgi:hypothetical protein